MTDIVKFLNERKFTVLFSGGKDSLASLLWVLDNVKHSNWNILYIEVTGNTHHLCTQYVIEICKKLNVYNKLIITKRKDLDFFECLKKWGIPIIYHARWCLYNFKTLLMKKYSYTTQVTGIKRNDSWLRRSRSIIDVFKLTKNILVNPILEWSTNQVIDFIKEHGVELNPCYSKFGHSGNCMFCPAHNLKEIKLTMRDPYWGKKITRALIEANFRGKISRKIARRWLRYANLKSITEYLNIS